MRSTSDRISARSASIRSSERSSSTTEPAAMLSPPPRIVPAGATATGAGLDSGTMTEVTPRTRRGWSTKFQAKATIASATSTPCASSDSTVG